MTQDGFFGIDLGTTYSVVSYIDASGKAVVVRDILADSDTTPSVVYFENETNVVVGAVAKETASIAPNQVVKLIKREMGNKEWRQTFFGNEYSPAGIAALILGALAKSAEADTGRRVDSVVITVPAYFGMLEKETTRQAGEIAGLNVAGIVPEPVAAAISYGLTSDASEKKILVFDLGGGTFDVTLIDVTPDSVEVIVVDGDHLLGGADWDAVLFDRLAEAVSRELGDDTLLEDPHFVQLLWEKSEDTKKKLSQTESRPVILQAGGGQSVKVTVTRAEFEQLTAHLVDKTVEITKRALATAEEKSPGVTGQITDVLLVGGSSKMPVIASTLKHEFGWDAKLSDPDLAVARGAALYAAGEAARDIVQKTAEDEAAKSGPPAVADDGYSVPVVATAEQREAAIGDLAVRTGINVDELDDIAKVKVTNALPKAVGIKLIDTSIPNWEEQLRNSPDPRTGPFFIHHLVDPQTPLPYVAPEPFKDAGTTHAGQDVIAIELWEQAGGVPGRAVAENNALPVKEGAAQITDLGQYNLPENSPIHIYFDVSAEGIVTLRAVEPVSNKEATVKATVALLTQEEVDKEKANYNGLTVTTN